MAVTLVCAMFFAAAASEALPPAQPEPAAEQGVVAPVPIEPPEIPFPSGAAPIETEVEVEVLLRIDEHGEVSQVLLVRGAGAPFDEAVLIAATRFKFEPARHNGKPVEVEVPFTQRFLPPPKPPANATAGPPLDAELFGIVIEKGTRKSVAGARVVATLATATGSGEYVAETSAGGRFALPLPSGRVRVEVIASGYKRFLVQAEISRAERLEVRLLVERVRFDAFEVTVIGRPEKVEVARTTLRDREIHHVPGTFGDPFRVIGTLPGVGQIMSLLGYPVVRGTSPGNTGFLIDGVRVPQLFHFLGGPSVIHPEFIDRVDFYPGAFPAQYGGYTGGIVDGITRRARADEHRLDVDLDLVHTGGLVREPLPFIGATATLAGRYGYPGLLLSAFSEDAFASYWDYQARLDGGSQSEGWTVFSFGAFDEIGQRVNGEDRTDMRNQFHRVDLRYTIGNEDDNLDRYELTLGVDELLGDDNAGDLATYTAHPRARFHRRFFKELQLRFGLEATGRRFYGGMASDMASDGVDAGSHMISGGAFVDLPFWVTERLLLTPGARFDIYQNDRTTQQGFDPRLLWRYAVEDSESRSLWLKGGLGIYHQPPRFFIPIPGFEEIALEQGLLASSQANVGFELEFERTYSIDTQVYYHHMDPILFDIAINADGEEDFLSRRVGRSYGLEVMLRRRDGGDLFGWLSYTLSRSERKVHDEWVFFDFDRTHMAHLVLGYKLPRNWELGGRFQIQSGRPVSGFDETLRRTPPFFRFDVRIDKRAVYQDWLLDFYIDIMNATVASESMGEDEDMGIRYVLPTVGFRAVL